METKTKYAEYCKNAELPIFNKNWWLDAVCGPDNWDVIVIEKDNRIIASWPYYLRKNILRKTIISMPLQTQTLGPWLEYPSNIKYVNKISYEKKICRQLISLLPKVFDFSQNFHYSITNWLPFYWAGFTQTTRYTYIIEDTSDLNKILENFDGSKRTDINKALNYKIKIIDNFHFIDFYNYHRDCLNNQGKHITYSEKLFTNIYNACTMNDSCKILAAIDDKNIIHAAIFLVYDSDCVYNLISAIDSKYRYSGASTLLFLETIKFAASLNLKYNFEGSMIEAIEDSYRKFGGRQVPYFSIRKTYSKFLPLLISLKGIIK